jgi:hypothetical protein
MTVLREDECINLLRKQMRFIEIKYPDPPCEPTEEAIASLPEGQIKEDMIHWIVNSSLIQLLEKRLITCEQRPDGKLIIHDVIMSV